MRTKNINTVIIQFLCHNKGKGFSAIVIADAIGIKIDSRLFISLVLEHYYLIDQ